MASTSGNKNINVVVVLCFILLVAFSSSAYEISDRKTKFMKFPPSPNIKAENTKTPANKFHRGYSPLTRCLGDTADQPEKCPIQRI